MVIRQEKRSKLLLSWLLTLKQSGCYCVSWKHPMKQYSSHPVTCCPGFSYPVETVTSHHPLKPCHWVSEALDLSPPKTESFYQIQTACTESVTENTSVAQWLTEAVLYFIVFRHLVGQNQSNFILGLWTACRHGIMSFAIDPSNCADMVSFLWR